MFTGSSSTIMMRAPAGLACGGGEIGAPRLAPALATAAAAAATLGGRLLLGNEFSLIALSRVVDQTRPAIAPEAGPRRCPRPCHPPAPMVRSPIRARRLIRSSPRR